MWLSVECPGIFIRHDLGGVPAEQVDSHHDNRITGTAVVQQRRISH